MLLLVLGNSFLALYVGWEGVGLASYLLIAFWYYKPDAATAAKKAFIANRVGDVGLSLAIMLIGIWLPYSPIAPFLSFVPLPWQYWPLIALTLLSYVALTQVVKSWLFRRGWI